MLVNDAYVCWEVRRGGKRKIGQVVKSPLTAAAAPVFVHSKRAGLWGGRRGPHQGKLFNAKLFGLKGIYVMDDVL